MSHKIFIFLLFILILTFIVSSNKENENMYNSETNNKDDDLIGNPYFILKVPPWAKFKDVRKRYNKLKEKAELKKKTNTKVYKKIEKAFKILEEEYIKNDYKDKTFFEVLFNTFKNIFFYELIMLVLLFITWFIYKFNTYAALLVVVFVTIDNLIPHWFSTMFTQYVVSFLLGTILYFREYFYPFICGKKENSNDFNENTNNGGSFKRRRFEKIE